MTERHGERPDTPVEEPAPTLTSKARSDVWVVVPMDRPSPTFTSKSGSQWIFSRPATTIVASFRPDIVASFRPDIVAAPGYRGPGDGPRQNAEGSIKITVQEAAILQSFRPDYPWMGSRSKQFQQVGNAVPPRLGVHILAALLGLPLPGGL